MATAFQYDRVMRMANDLWAENEMRFFGNIVSGSISLGDVVSVPIVGGAPVETIVGRFTEDFSDNWIGMPFCDSVKPDASGVPFCICVDGTPLLDKIIAVPAQIMKRATSHANNS